MQGCCHRGGIDAVVSWKWFTRGCGIARWASTCLGCPSWLNVEIPSQSTIKSTLTCLEVGYL